MFSFEHHGIIFGTIRATPMTHGLTLTEQLLLSIGEGGQNTPIPDWEVGRLVLKPEYRSGQNLLKWCFYLTLEYLCAHCEVRSLRASCSHQLSRLYRRFGYAIQRKDVPLTGTEKVYTLIQGEPNTVLETLRNGDRSIQSLTQH